VDLYGASVTILKTTSEFRNVSVTWWKWAWLAGRGRQTIMHGKQSWIGNCK